MEFHDVQQHPQEAGTDEIAPLGKDRIEGGPVVLQATLIAAYTEAHRRITRRDAELVNDGGEDGVDGLDDDDIAGVDGVADENQIDIAVSPAKTRFRNTVR